MQHRNAVFHIQEGRRGLPADCHAAMLPSRTRQQDLTCELIRRQSPRRRFAYEGLLLCPDAAENYKRRSFSRYGSCANMGMEMLL